MSEFQRDEEATTSRTTAATTTTFVLSAEEARGWRINAEVYSANIPHPSPWIRKPSAGEIDRKCPSRFSGKLQKYVILVYHVFGTGRSAFVGVYSGSCESSIILFLFWMAGRMVL